MKIHPLADAEIAVFDNLARSCGTIFDTVAWTQMFGSAITRYGIYDRGERLLGGFSLFCERKFWLSIYRQAPFTPTMGPFVLTERVNPVSIMDTWKEILWMMAGVLKEGGPLVVLVSLNKNIVDMQPFLWEKFKVSPRYTYILDLRRPLEELWRRMSSERRKNITKGRKDGLIVSQTEDYSIVERLTLQTFMRQAISLDSQYLKKILYEFANKRNSYVYVTSEGNDPVACCFCVHDAATAYYLIGGYDMARKHHGAVALSMWEAITHAHHLGLKTFDFEGSMLPNVESYFRGFGGDLVPYYQVIKAKLPMEFVLKLYRREVF